MLFAVMACNLLDWIRLVRQQTGSGFQVSARLRINYLGWGFTRGHLNKQEYLNVRWKSNRYS